MALSEAQWEALRAEYCASPISGRALARKYGVNEASIRERRARNPDAWRRDPRVAEAIQEEGQRRTLEGAVRSGVLAATHAATQVRGRAGDGADQAAEATVDAITGMLSDARAVIDEAAGDAQAELIARTNLDHLARARRLKALFDQHAELLSRALVFPSLVPGQDGKQQVELGDEQVAALGVLVGQTRDTLASHLQAAAAMAEKIQLQERRALGVEQRPKKLELSGPGGGPIESSGSATLGFDAGNLSTAQLAALYEAGTILAGAQERPPLPLPPGDPELPDLPVPPGGAEDPGAP